MNLSLSVKSIYFYLVSFISLLVILFNLQGVGSTVLREFVLKSSPKYSYVPPVFPPTSQSYPYYDPASKLPPHVENQNKELLQALKNNASTSAEQKQAIDQWFADYERWKTEQENTKQRALDNLIGNTLAVLIFTPVFYFHFKKAREL